MHDLYKLRDILVKELEGYGKTGELSKPSLDAVNKIAHAAKNVCKVIDYCEKDKTTDSAIRSFNSHEPDYDEVKETLREDLRKMVEAF